MGSTFGGLNTVVRGLYAQQVSLDTVGHNVSNANTVGYSRQNVNLATTRPQTIYGANGENQVGTGVTIESITRARDTFIDKQMWKESASLGYGEKATDTLGRIEGVFHEPSDSGLQTTMDRFWSAWQSLATNAGDDGTRTAVRQRGVEMVDTIQHATRQLTDMIADTNSVIDIKVNNINQLSSEVYALNRQIVTIEAGGMDHANDLRDSRDALVDQMAKMTSINVTQDKYGNYTIQSAGVPLVDGAGYQKLATATTRDADYGYEIKNIVVAGSSQALTFTNGELRGLLEMRDAVSTNNSYDGIKGYLKKLDTISEFLLKDFNDVHKAGLGTDNSTGNNFFGDASANYNPAPPAAPYTLPANTMGWIAQLKVNPALFNAANGLKLIAAKTSINNLSVQQSNTVSGAATVNSTYAGTTPLNYIVKLGSAASDISAAGVVNAVSVSLDNGKTWTAGTSISPAMEQTVGTGGVATGDITYTGAATTAPNYMVKIGSATAGVVNTATVSFDGGTTWLATTAAIPATTPSTFQINSSSGLLSIQIANHAGNAAGNIYTSTPATVPKTFQLTSPSGIVNIQIATDNHNTLGDTYNFSVNQGNASGDNAVKLANSMKTNTTSTLGDSTLDSFYNSIIGALGVQTQSAASLTANQKTLVTQITNWRESVSGVNMDEEMANMIRFQKGYAAAARVLTSMDEILDKLINSTGVVGR